MIFFLTWMDWISDFFIFMEQEVWKQNLGRDLRQRIQKYMHPPINPDAQRSTYAVQKYDFKNMKKKIQLLKILLVLLNDLWITQHPI